MAVVVRYITSLKCENFATDEEMPLEWMDYEADFDNLNKKVIATSSGVEVQFMDEHIIGVLEEQANMGRRVIVAGLDLDSEGQPFGPMARLLAVADKVTKLTAVCVAHNEELDGPCGEPATRTFRLPDQDTGEQVQVGSAGMYEARCRVCWANGMRK